MTWQQTARALALGVALLASSGCAATMRKAAKDAGPAAVEGSVQTAHEPRIRNEIADVLSDPEIRGGMSQFSQAVADGVLNSLTEPERLSRAETTSDAFAEHMSRTLARSLERDFAPAVSNLVAGSVAQTLDDKFDERVALMARAVARGSVDGLAEGLSTRLAQSDAALYDTVKRIARTAGREAALGFRDAVEASTQRQKAGADAPGDVLAAAGRTSDSLLLALRLAGWLLVIAVVCVALSASVWAIRRLRRPPTEGGRPRPAHA